MKWLLALCAMLPASGFACVATIEVTDSYAKICVAADSCREIAYESIPNTSQARKNELVRAGFQQYFDKRQLLDGIEAEDPDKGSDPGCDNLYWGLADGTPESDPAKATHLIGRGCVVEDVAFDGVEYIFHIRATSPCPTLD